MTLCGKTRGRMARLINYGIVGGMKPISADSEIFRRGVEDVVTEEELIALLKSGRKLRIKLGIDATSPDLHIGHAVALWKIRALQEAGHKAVILLGDFTTRIGDPTGRIASRPVLSPATIKKNCAAIMGQITKILLVNAAVFEQHKNSEWFGKMNVGEFLNLTASVTHARLIEREMFRHRIERGIEISVSEILYPILQGYDSVAMKSDLTIIGSDQLFNEHMGRFFQGKYGQRPQTIVTCKILPGLDGGEKMSKSLGNYIGIADPPREKFGKAMRLADNLIFEYLRVYTDVSEDEIRQWEARIASGGNPRDAKLFFAESLVRRYHGASVAQKEREAFLAMFSKKEIPDKIPTRHVQYGPWHPVELVVALSLAASKSEARRLLKQRAVKIDKKLVEPSADTILVRKGSVVQAGKRKMVRIR